MIDKVGYYRLRNGQIVRVLCVDLHVAVRPIVAAAAIGSLTSYRSDGKLRSLGEKSENDIIEYLPDCTGFDWEPVTYREPVLPGDMGNVVYFSQNLEQWYAYKLAGYHESHRPWIDENGNKWRHAKIINDENGHLNMLIR